MLDLRSILVRAPLSESSGVLDYVDARDDYCDNFGLQWNLFSTVQIDSISKTAESASRFYAETGWAPAELEGKLLLDAGCGAGRFAEVALSAGAKIVAVDLSHAVRACRKTLSRFDPSRYLVIRADLRDLPLRPSAFDGVYSLGVLQHTPDPLASLTGLARYLKPGGRLATWIYERRSPDVRLLQPRTHIRRLTQRWTPARKLLLSRAVTAAFFPAGWALSWLGRSGERLSHFLPYAARHHLGRGDLRRQWDYCVQDTFDWYGPTYDEPQRQEDVITAMERCGLVNVRRLPARGMAIVGERAASSSG